jgi:anti-sigma B factor antagonist
MQTVERMLPNGWLLELSGAIVFETAPRLRRLLRSKACDCSPVLLLDLSRVSRLDSSGAATLLEHYQHSRRYSGRTVLAGMNHQGLDLLRLLGLENLFEFFATAEQARQALGVSEGEP